MPLPNGSASLAACAAAAALLTAAAPASADRTIAFDKRKLGSGDNDACAFGDFNKDGRLDLACGDSWYEAPNWTPRVFRPNRHEDVLLPLDVDEDGFPDLVSSAHGHMVWYRNNGATSGHWAMQETGCLGGHSGDLLDIDGDGRKREVLSSVEGQPTVWSEPVGGKWVCWEISKAHHNWGAGIGDVDGDGRMDIIRPDAWYKAPADRRRGIWTGKPIALGALEDRPNGDVQPLAFVERIHELRNSVGQHGHTVQLYAQDVDGDGLNDLIASSAHRMGVMWYKQFRSGADISFRSRIIDGELSILHSLAQVDMDKDGDLDLLTGKRWRGHGKDEDPFTEAPLFVAWYEKVPQAPFWKRHFLTYGEGITSGTQIGVGDYDKDGDPDVAVIAVAREGQGSGPWLFTNRAGEATVEEKALPVGNTIHWRKHRLDSLPARAAAFGDFNGDGRLDVAAGDFWYEAPAWTRRRFRAMEGAVDARGYGDFKQDGMLSALDADEDGKVDLVGGSRLGGLLWYRNPGNAQGTGNWPVTVVDPAGDYETGGLVDVDGDGKPREILSSGALRGTRFWAFKAGRWSSRAVAGDSSNLGAGAGDVNGDGRADIIRPDAIYLAPPDPMAGAWTRKVVALGAIDDRPFLGFAADVVRVFPKGPDWLGRNERGGHGHTSRIFVHDINKDGRADIVTSSAHRVGISWWSQQADGNFLQNIIDASWSQAHASAFGDIDGDGDPDFVAGKDFLSQGDNDPYSDGDLVVNWYELRPGQQPPFLKHPISAGEGIGGGGDMALSDMDGDGDLDIAVTGKNGGPTVFENLGKTPAALGRDGARGLPGGQAMPGFKDGAWKAGGRGADGRLRGQGKVP